jgi:acyl-coenzyme A synthetase/AMP-(fatty) acid ligase
MHVLDMVYFWARTMPRRPAMIQPEGILTYRAFVDAVEAAARHFAERIPDKSKPVAVAIGSQHKMLIACFGLFRAGFNVMPASRELFAHLSGAGALTVVVEHGSDEFEGFSNVAFEDRWFSFANRPDDAAPVPLPRTGDVGMYYFTSGTTGRPKLVVQNLAAWEERMLISNNSVFVDYERAMLVPGLSGAYGFNRACEVLHEGKTLCFAPFGAATLQVMETFAVDMLVASTHQALALAELQEKATRLPLAALRCLRIGGDLISREGAERMMNHLCRNVVLSYASTEAGTAAMAPYEAIADIPGAVGFVLPGIDIQIVDDANQPLPAGQEGFIRIRSPQYLKNYSITASDQWFYPGDVGRLTESGVLCVAGRTGDVINRGGAKWSVTDFEQFLMKAPGVADAGVCTLLGESGTGEVWVGVVFGPNADVPQFQRYIEADERFGRNIDKLFVVEEVPRGELGKVQRPQLLNLLLEIYSASET